MEETSTISRISANIAKVYYREKSRRGHSQKKKLPVHESLF